jgi:glycine/D-amino acid oxidase-like deaminating enzyme
MQQPVLIVGGGLSGISVASALLDRAYPFFVFDKPLSGCSSAVAAGIINPIVFKRLSISWGWEDFFSFACAFYQKWEQETGQFFFSNARVRRQMPDVVEIQQWDRKRAESELHRRLLSEITKVNESFIIKPRSSSEAFVEGAALLDVPKFLNAARILLRQKGKWHETYFDYSELKRQSDGTWLYGGVVYKAVVFCEGYRVINNPFFPDHEIIPCKGEVLHYENPGLPEHEIQYRKINLVPYGDLMLAGSNYHNHDISDGPDADGVAELISLTEDCFYESPVLKEVRWGIRPTTLNRRPRIRCHPSLSGLWMFNGMGSKGALSAPWLALRFVHDELCPSFG